MSTRHIEKNKKLLVSQETSLKAAMRTLSEASSRILFVTDGDGRLIGSITDGDMRRAILNNVGFDQAVSEIMFKTPRFVRHGEDSLEEKAKGYVLVDRLYAVPVLDDIDRIVDILFWHDFFENHPHEPQPLARITNPVVIMAGGRGERLDPFTKILPKPLIPFDGKPILDKLMDNFYRCGFTNFILTLNYKKDLIKAYLKENKFPYKVEYVEEDEYLGTAGSIALLKDRIKESFFVCNCDILLTKDLKNILFWHKAEKALVTLIGCHKELVIPYGTIEVKEGILTSIKEKPTYDMIINTGVYVMEPEIMNLISPGEHLDMNHLAERAMRHGKTTVYPIADGWFDIGQWKEYRDSLYLLQNINNKK